MVRLASTPMFQMKKLSHKESGNMPKVKQAAELLLEFRPRASDNHDLNRRATPPLNSFTFMNLAPSGVPASQQGLG